MANSALSLDNDGPGGPPLWRRVLLWPFVALWGLALFLRRHWRAVGAVILGVPIGLFLLFMAGIFEPDVIRCDGDECPFFSLSPKLEIARHEEFGQGKDCHEIRDQEIQAEEAGGREVWLRRCVTVFFATPRAESKGAVNSAQTDRFGFQRLSGFRPEFEPPGSAVFDRATLNMGYADVLIPFTLRGERPGAAQARPGLEAGAGLGAGNADGGRLEGAMDRAVQEWLEIQKQQLAKAAKYPDHQKRRERRKSQLNPEELQDLIGGQQALRDCDLDDFDTEQPDGAEKLLFECVKSRVLVTTISGDHERKTEPMGKRRGEKTLRQAFAEALYAELLKQPEENEGEVFLYIHGFNQTFNQAVADAAQLAVDLNHTATTALQDFMEENGGYAYGVPVIFSWPNEEDERFYPRDKYFNSKITAPDYLAHFLDLLTSLHKQSDTIPGNPVKRINIVVHSMGNRVFQFGFDKFLSDHLAGSRRAPQFRIVHAAADIRPYGDFSYYLQKLQQSTRDRRTGAGLYNKRVRSTAVYAGVDNALICSSWANVLLSEARRAGRPADPRDRPQRAENEIDAIDRLGLVKDSTVIDDMYPVCIRTPKWLDALLPAKWLSRREAHPKFPAITSPQEAVAFQSLDFGEHRVSVGEADKVDMMHDSYKNLPSMLADMACFFDDVAPGDRFLSRMPTDAADDEPHYWRAVKPGDLAAGDPEDKTARCYAKDRVFSDWHSGNEEDLFGATRAEMLTRAAVNSCVALELRHAVASGALFQAAYSPAEAPGDGPSPSEAPKDPLLVAATNSDALCRPIDTAVYFDLMDVSLDRAARSITRTIAAKALRCGDITAVELIGHADQSGDEGYNQGLSQKRAEIVRDRLISQGLPADLNWQVYGVGETDPKEPKVDCCLREPENRRVDVLITFGNPPAEEVRMTPSVKRKRIEASYRALRADIEDYCWAERAGYVSAREPDQPTFGAQ